MKKLFSTLLLALFLILPVSASAQMTVPQGGTGYNAIQSGSILFGNTSLRLGTSTALQWNNSQNRLTVTNASTTNVTISGYLNIFGTMATALSDLCVAITGGSGLCDGSDATGAGGSSSIATSTGETAGQLAVWTSTNATPATLGKVATSSVTINSPLTSAGTPGYVVGGSGWTLDVDDIGAADLASADFGSFTCNGSSCTVDSQAISASMLANADFGDFTCSGGSCTVDANAIALSTDTTGNFVATVSSSGSITVGNSGSENAAVTVDLNMGNANTWTALQTFTNASTTGYHSFGTASSTNWTGGGLTDCDADNQTVSYDATTMKFGCGDDDSGAGGSGSVTTIQEGDSSVGDPDIVTLDFGAGFDLTESPDTEVNFALDLLEYNGAALFTNVTMTNASSSAISANTLAVGGTATTSISSAGTITIGGNIVFAGDTFDELVGTGLQITSGDLQTTLGVAIDSSEITDGTIAVGDIASADFGDFTCNGSACTVDANAIALTTDTTGNYIATLADDGQSTVTVTNGSGEGGAATLRVIDVVCTDCLGATEIADSYLLNTGDVGTGDYDFGGASSFEIVNAAAPTVNAAGEIALDTTDNQLVVGDSGNAEAVFGRKNIELFKFDLASTSPRFVSGAYQPLPQYADAYTVTRILCYTTSGTSKQIAVSDGTNDMDTITCDADGATDDGSIANSTVTAAEIMRVKMLTTSGAVDSVSVTIIGTITRE